MTFRINGENNSFDLNQKSTLKSQKKQTEDFSKLQEILSNYSGQKNIEPQVPRTPQPPSEKLPLFKDDGSVEWIENPDYNEQMRQYKESTLPDMPRGSQPPSEKLPLVKDDGSVEWIENPDYDEQMRQYEEKNTPRYE